MSCQKHPRALPAAFLAVALLAVAPPSPPPSATSGAGLRAALQRNINQYLTSRAKIEHLSAIAVSVSLRGRSENLDLTAGRTQWNAGEPVTPANLWQIGSNTKAFTAATILQLEAEGKLTVDQTVGRWLPQYPAWKNVTIRRLLNMTSGIPSYDEVPAMLAAYARNPKQTFTIPELIAYVYPVNNPNAPRPTTGYSYSNTNYILAELIIERASGHSYASQLDRRFFTPLHLSDTSYSETQYPRSVVDRMVAGYFFNRDPDVAPLAPLLGTDQRANTVSWMRSTGGIVSTPEDLTRWARALYSGPMLAAKQRAELLGIVSLKTGKPIAKTSPADPRGFGLGVVQLTDPGMKETVWFYEGDTMGYRVGYVYCPREDAVFAYALNSLPDANQNQSGKLAVSLYKTLLASNFKS